jgi:peptidoglycan/xylan/chitin deacetylase (PgdA/CDA1 family)
MKQGKSHAFCFVRKPLPAFSAFPPSRAATCSDKSWMDLCRASPRIISQGSRLEPYVYLSFDDGPDPKYTPRLLDMLAAAGAHANFFVVGAACQRHPALLNRILSEGHTIGSHSFSHRHPWVLSTTEARQEVRQGFDAITAIGNHSPRFFRPPYGRLRMAMMDETHALGMQTVLWSRSAIDWGTWGKPSAVARRLSKTRPGDILLLHDAVGMKNRPAAMLALLPDFLGKCKQRGLQFGKLERLTTADQIITSNILSHPEPRR